MWALVQGSCTDACSLHTMFQDQNWSGLHRVFFPPTLKTNKKSNKKQILDCTVKPEKTRHSLESANSCSLDTWSSKPLPALAQGFMHECFHGHLLHSWVLTTLFFPLKTQHKSSSRKEAAGHYLAVNIQVCWVSLQRASHPSMSIKHT